ncbi:aminopeptidase P N-terminal domain-containing protein [Horticoccus luteus]|uniref:Xaa-Pro aminopeptidase n=1 Tax=Horticoccus luteus TaxID=2862869 RepID=A0A8F9XMP3_9BACT|nr:aminopeptidase P N-terminal domain-containing protein [Horticoccus luteus]QYM80244.1 aminopeptidase P N-terminal domain-containing protein [Horticoccus luteus]
MPYLDERRARVARALDLHDELLLVGAGEPIPLPENSDQTYPFRAHADYYYLAALECPGGVVALDPRDGETSGWISFVPEVTEAERVWEGREQPPGTPLAQLDEWLASRAGRPVLTFGAPVPRAGLAADAAASAAARTRFVHARRAKDSTEIALIRRAADATAHGFSALVAALRPGVTERALQVELECGFARAGGRRPGYGTIVGTGPHAAILHFDPSERAARDGEFVLVDAGAEIDRYMADVTRTYVVGQATPFQRDLYAIVLSTEQNAIARCVAGAEWKAVHLAAAVEMVDGLVQLGLMRGSAESLVEQEAHTLFFPHGLGHLVGLGVRDGSGQAPGRAKDPRAGLRSLRLDLPLQPGYVVTVEPGLYFIPALLNDPARRQRFHDCVNWDAVTPHLALGGVRIEDNVLVTTGAPEILTSAIPKPAP